MGRGEVRVRICLNKDAVAHASIGRPFLVWWKKVWKEAGCCQTNDYGNDQRVGMISI